MLSAGPWTRQGYPFLSGLGRYRRAFGLTRAAADDWRILLEVPMADDVLEVELNGQTVGVCLWDPYVVDVTNALQDGVNELELRVANTAANLIGGTERPSGLAGPPRLVARRAARSAPAGVRT